MSKTLHTTVPLLVPSGRINITMLRRYFYAHLPYSRPPIFSSRNTTAIHAREFLAFYAWGLLLPTTPTFPSTGWREGRCSGYPKRAFRCNGLFLRLRYIFFCSARFIIMFLICLIRILAKNITYTIILTLARFKSTPNCKFY